MEKNKIKSEIIPDDMKYHIDEILEDQLFNANRYYAESSTNIYELMEDEKIKKSELFLNELKHRWNWHNLFYEDIFEPAFLEVVKEKNIELTPKDIEEIIEIYITCCLVDEATLVTSGAIKKHLEYHLPYISLSCEDVNEQDALFMLLTPPVESFFIAYQIDHLKYIILLKSDIELAKEYKKYLLNKYHANDEMIFKGRFAKKFSNDMERSIEELLTKIDMCKIKDNYKTQHFYFTFGHEDRSAFRDLLIYDNIDEKLISSQLIGISGFLFRKKVLEYLDSSNILKNSGYIYEYSKDTIIDNLQKLKKEREKNMELNVKPYRQHGMTCAIACMLMVLDYYDIIEKPTKLHERKYFKSYQSKWLEGTPLSSVAWHFAKNGLDTEILHSEKDIFSNKNHMISDYVFDNAMIEYKSYLEWAKNNGAIVSSGDEISAETIKEKLANGKMVVLAGQGYSVLHTILVCGYRDNKFIVCDPQYNEKKSLTKEQLTNFMTTDIGKWCIVVSEKKLNKDKLMDEIPEFQKEANKKLKVESTKKYIKTSNGEL